MIVDKRTEFFDRLVIPAAGTAVLGDVVDTGPDQRDLGNGRPVYWYLACEIAAAGGTSIQANLVSSASSAMTSPVVHLSTPTILLANIKPGKLLFIAPLPLEGPAYLRYLGVQCVTAGTFTGGGAITSGLSLDPAGWKAYRDGAN